MSRLDHVAAGCMVIVTCLIGATLPLGAVANAPSLSTKLTPRQTVHRVDDRLDRVRDRIVALERVASRFQVWLRCIRPIPVDRVGDEDRPFGFLYDQVDSTGVHHRGGLVLHQGPGRARFALLAFDRRPACWSAPVTPNGTGADAKAATQKSGSHSRPRRPLARSVRKLERRIVRLEKRIKMLERAADRFDEWESCLSAVPLTEQGDPMQRFGYHYRAISGSTYRHALDVDSSEWDDPDYQLLAFIGRDRPFRVRECSRDPGEAPDKVGTVRSARSHAAVPKSAPRGELADDIAQVAVDSRELAEDLPDLRVALAEFSAFDQCMYTVGVSYLGSTADRTGYLYAGPGGNVTARPAMALALDGEIPARWDFLAFPGEEPPQIECNEDAGGQDTEE